MRKLKSLFGQGEFHILIFFFGLFSLSWPIVGVLERKHPAFVLVYLFFMWLSFIIILFLIGRSIPKGNEGGREGVQEGD